MLRSRRPPRGCMMAHQLLAALAPPPRNAYLTRVDSFWYLLRVYCASSCFLSNETRQRKKDPFAPDAGVTRVCWLEKKADRVDRNQPAISLRRNQQPASYFLSLPPTASDHPIYEQHFPIKFRGIGALRIKETAGEKKGKERGGRATITQRPPPTGDSESWPGARHCQVRARLPGIPSLTFFF